ncbi:transposase [Pseudoalteromonas maricaloris]|uniref:transposase n=1 Tax=Pseudoalteromonas TaxID=53246 RepID=UPI0009DB331A
MHLIVNHIGEIVALKLTNVDDRKLVTEMAYTLFRKLCGYRSYINTALSGELIGETM